MKISCVRGAMLLLAVGLASGSARAEPLPSINLRGFSPPPGPSGMLYMEPVNTPGSLQYNMAGWLSWAWRPLVVRRGGEVASSIVKQQASLDALFGIGLGKRGEVGVALPVVLAQGGDESAETARVLGESRLPSQALGDLTLAGKVNLKPIDEEFGGFGLAAVGRLTLPTGDRTSTLGEGAATTELRVLGEMRVVKVSLTATTGFKLRAKDREFGGKTWGDEIPWGVGLWLKPQMIGLDGKGRWRLGLEAHGSLPAGPDTPFTSKAQSPAFLGTTARYTVRDLSVTGGLEFGITQGAGAPPLRLVAGASWAPRDHDKDHDGIEDDVDECPNHPEDKDGFEDRDGCPDPDNDNDNVNDPEDRCPLEPEDEDGFQDEDGCPDPDNDKDGILDEVDGCPDEVGVASPDPQQNGCPVRDPDGDGVQGDADRCPEQPEDKDGFEDEDGCPDPDNDGDGIADAEDQCPLQKGEASQMPGQNGCPSTDRDGDAIPNESDKCPDEAETYNGVDDDDGCPEAAKPRQKPLAEVTEKKGEKQLALGAPIRFKKGTTELDARSAAVVRAVAQRLAASPSSRVSVAVRPAPADGGEDLAKARAAVLVEMLIRGSRRPGAAGAAGWQRGKMPAQSEVSGVAVVLGGSP